MCKASYKLPEDLLNRLSSLGSKTDEICEKVLQAGAEVVERKIASNLSASIGKNLKSKSRSTGELARSLGVSPVKQNKNGNLDIKVGFSEPRSDGGSNAKVANILEYGKHGQPARPFLKPAKSACKNAVLAAMQNAFEEEVGRL